MADCVEREGEAPPFGELAHSVERQLEALLPPVEPRVRHQCDVVCKQLDANDAAQRDGLGGVNCATVDAAFASVRRSQEFWPAEQFDDWVEEDGEEQRAEHGAGQLGEKQLSEISKRARGAARGHNTNMTTCTEHWLLSNMCDHHV